MYGFSEIGILIKNKRLTPKTKNQNGGLLQIVVPFFLTWFVAMFEALLENHKWDNLSFSVGMIVLVTGIVLRLVALVQIGKGFSIKIEKNDDQVLIKTGLYRYIRHPLYLASILQITGTIVMLCSKYSWVLFPLLIYGIVSRIKGEEIFMVKEFKEYKMYQNRTWKLIPWVY